MENTAYQLLYHISTLLHHKRMYTLIRDWVKKLNQLYPHLDVTYHQNFNENAPGTILIGNSSNNYGAIQLERKPGEREAEQRGTEQKEAQQREADKGGSGQREQVQGKPSQKQTIHTGSDHKEPEQKEKQQIQQTADAVFVMLQNLEIKKYIRGDREQAGKKYEGMPGNSQQNGSMYEGMPGGSKQTGSKYEGKPGASGKSQREAAKPEADSENLKEDLQQKEKVLREKEEKLRNIVEHSTNLFYSHTTDHILTYVSPRSWDFFDCSPEEAKIRWTDFLSDHPINRQGIETTNRAIENGQTQPPYELELITRKNRRLWVEVHEAPMIKEGKVHSIIGALVDITERKKAEKELQENEKKYRTVFENTGTATIIIEEDTTISLVNQQFTKLYKAPREKIENQLSWTQFAHRDDLEQMKKYHHQRRKSPGKVPKNYEFRLIDASGEHHNIYITIDMIPGTRKSVASFQDITERKRFEEKLREREEHFRDLFHKNSSVLMLVEPKTGKIYDVNEKAAEFYGYSRDELKSKYVTDINTLSKKQVKEEMKQAAQNERNYFIFSHQLANGEIRDVEVYTGLITIQGKRLLYSTIHDITGETENRKRLQKGEEIAKIGHWEFNLNNRRVYSSLGARRIYGIEKENLTMEEVQQIPMEEYRDKLDKALKDLVEKGKPYEVDFRIQRPIDKQIRYIHSIAEYNPKRHVVFGTIQDITERKETERKLKIKNEELQATEEELRASNEELRDINERLESQKQELEKAKEKAEESDRLKSSFLANMSHEIRTPMNGIMGFAQLLKEKEIPATKRKEFLDIIHSRTRHLLQIINDIVDISKIEANQLDIQKENFDLNNLMDNLYQEQKKVLQDLHKSHLQLHLSRGVPQKEFFIYGDINRIRQILYNLLSNAMKFTKKGYIEFGYQPQNNQGINFFVRDTGIGIPKEKYDEIFERFRQVDESSSRPYEGTGLGLTICKNLVEMMGGAIQVSPNEENGTRFDFFLPCQVNTGAGSTPPNEKENLNYDWQEKSILLVEDDPASQEYLKEGLHSTGVHVTTLETGEKTLEHIQEQPAFDLILMDIRLPGIDGLETTKRLRKYKPDVPVIAQTAHAMEEDQKKCIQAGANDYISKPIDIEKLLQKINQYI